MPQLVFFFFLKLQEKKLVLVDERFTTVRMPARSLRSEVKALLRGIIKTPNTDTCLCPAGTRKSLTLVLEN